MKLKNIFKILLLTTFSSLMTNSVAQNLEANYKYELLDLTDEQSVTNLNKSCK